MGLIYQRIYSKRAQQTFLEIVSVRRRSTWSEAPEESWDFTKILIDLLSLCGRATRSGLQNSGFPQSHRKEWLQSLTQWIELWRTGNQESICRLSFAWAFLIKVLRKKLPWQQKTLHEYQVRSSPDVSLLHLRVAFKIRKEEPEMPMLFSLVQNELGYRRYLNFFPERHQSVSYYICITKWGLA